MNSFGTSGQEYVFEVRGLHKSRRVLTPCQFGEMPLAALDFCVLAIAKIIRKQAALGLHHKVETSALGRTDPGLLSKTDPDGL
jgi:hypothetical protein